MSNFRMQFSQAIRPMSAKEVQWFEHAMRKVNPKTKKQERELLKKEPWRDPNSDQLACDFRVTCGEGYVVVESGDSGNVECAAELLKGFLAACRPKESLYLTWASYADRIIPDGFTGGLYFITATEIRAFDPWVEKVRLEAWFKVHGSLPRVAHQPEAEKAQGRFLHRDQPYIVDEAGWNTRSELTLAERFIHQCGGAEAYRSFLAREATEEEEAL